MARFAKLLMLPAAILLVCGCSSGNHPPVYRVTGKVTYQGSAVAGAEVMFFPTSGSEDVHPAQALTDKSGNYSLRTFFSADMEVNGARPGSYKVVITKIDVPEGVIDPYTTGKAPVIKHQLPEKYSDVATTPLTFEVLPQSNAQDFVLED